jgi:hypothetical protein
MSVLEKMKGKPSLFEKKSKEESPEDEDMEEAAVYEDEDEDGLVTAMEAFEAAETAADKAKALKSFIKLCD